MKSDLIVVQFVDKLGKFNSEDIQNYLDGGNQWQRPINEKDIVKIDYSYSLGMAGRSKAMTSGILLIHRVPD